MKRPTQTERMRAFFEARAGQWVPLPHILALGMAQFGARIKECRDEHHMDIENLLTFEDGVRYSQYRYRPAARQQRLFGDAA